MLRRPKPTAGNLPESFPPLDFNNLELRRLAAFVIGTTFVNIVIAGQLSYSAVSYMDSTGFCGRACHSVMNPEFSAYKVAPHSQVECVKCHIGPGAGSFVRSKMNGVRQLFLLASNTYSRPIPSPVDTMRPARETCGDCHASTVDVGERLRVITKYGLGESQPTGQDGPHASCWRRQQGAGNSWRAPRFGRSDSLRVLGPAAANPPVDRAPGRQRAHHRIYRERL